MIPLKYTGSGVSYPGVTMALLLAIKRRGSKRQHCRSALVEPAKQQAVEAAIKASARRVRPCLMHVGPSSGPHRMC